MAISGLPNPDIHRKCKRCHEWFDHHAVDLCWPPKTGLLSWVHGTLIESTDQVKEQKYYCRPCQELNAKAESRFRRQSIQGIVIATLVLVGFLVAWGLGLGDLLTGLAKGK